MVEQRKNKMISRQNRARRVLRINLDRLYIAHTRRIIETAATIRVGCSKNEGTHDRQQQGIGRASILRS